MRDALHLPTLRQLQFLAALAEHGQFSLAVEAVGVTQPTLSAGIRELEAAIGVTLVERGRTASPLTRAGEEAALRAQRLLAEAQDLVHAARGAGEPLAGEYRLGGIPTIAPFLLPRAIGLLRARFPKLRLALREDFTLRLVEQLRARTIDAALIALPYDAAGIEVVTIANDEFLFAAPPESPLARKPDLSPKDLVDAPLMLLEDGHCLRVHALSACRGQDLRSDDDVAATSLFTLVHMIAGGLGVSMLPKLAVDAGVAAGLDIVIRPFAQPVIGRSIGVAWRKGSAREDETRLLAKALKDSLNHG